MKAKDLNAVNSLLITEANRYGFDDVSITMKRIAELTKIEDTMNISRIVTKLKELGKIDIITKAGKTNEYKILSQDPVAADWSEKITEKQSAILRHNCYKYGFNVHSKLCNKLQLKVYIDDLTSEQASNLIESYIKLEESVADEEQWKQQFSNYPQNYDIKHYADLLDKDMDIEKTIIVPNNMLKTFIAHYSCAPISKSKLTSTFKLYYLNHYDLIYKGFEYHQYRNQESYLYSFDE